MPNGYAGRDFEDLVRQPERHRQTQRLVLRGTRASRRRTAPSARRPRRSPAGGADNGMRSKFIPNTPPMTTRGSEIVATTFSDFIDVVHPVRRLRQVGIEHAWPAGRASTPPTRRSGWCGRRRRGSTAATSASMEECGRLVRTFRTSRSGPRWRRSCTTSRLTRKISWMASSSYWSKIRSSRSVHDVVHLVHHRQVLVHGEVHDAVQRSSRRRGRSRSGLAPRRPLHLLTVARSGAPCTVTSGVAERKQYRFAVARSYGSSVRWSSRMPRITRNR